MSAVSNALARFAAEFASTEIPAHTARIVHHRLQENAAMAVAGCDQPSVERAHATLIALGSTGRTSILGRPDRLALPDASVLIAISIGCGWALERGPLEDVPFDGPIVAAALAAGEYAEARGAAVIAAVAVGSELGLRVERTLQARLAEAGWADGAVSSRLGAAAAAGRLLGLTAAQMVSALGLAATQVAGLAAASTSELGMLTPGKIAGDGVEAALLAAGGFEGPASPLEGRRGLFAVLGHARLGVDTTTEDLGRSWLIDTLEDRYEPSAESRSSNTRNAAAVLANAYDLSELFAASRRDRGIR